MVRSVQFVLFLDLTGDEVNNKKSSGLGSGVRPGWETWNQVFQALRLGKNYFVGRKGSFTQALEFWEQDQERFSFVFTVELEGDIHSVVS